MSPARHVLCSSFARAFAFGRRVEKFLANVSGRVCLLEMVNLPVVRPSRTGCVAAESFIVRMISLGQGLGAAQISMAQTTDELGKTHDPGGGCGGSSLTPKPVTPAAARCPSPRARAQ